MSEDKELVEVWRSEFERDIKPHFNLTNPDYNAQNKDGVYFYGHMNLAWASYLIAKRTQPSVVLPDPNSCYDIVVDHHEEVCEALTAAGIKYTMGE